MTRCVPARAVLFAWSAAFAILSAPLPALGDPAPDPAPAERDWDAMVFGYGWLSSLTADFSVGPVTAELDESIIDLVPQLTWVVAGGAEGRYQRFVFGVDGLGQQLQITERTPSRSIALDPLGGAFGGLTGSRAASSASIRTTEVMVEATVGWRALALPVSQLFASVPASDRRQIWLDLLGGARYWYWRTEVRLSIAPVTIQAANPPPLPDGLRGRIADRILSRLSLPRSIQVGGSNAVLEDTVSWTDGLIGFRVGGDVTDTLSLTFRADVGGFGFGDSSDVSWQVMPGVQWRFAENWTAAFNWRAIGFNRANVDNVIFYGALLGIGYRF